MGMHDRDWYKNKSNNNNLLSNGKNKNIYYGSSGKDYKYIPPKNKFNFLSFVFNKIIYPLSALIVFGIIWIILLHNMLFN